MKMNKTVLTSTLFALGMMSASLSAQAENYTIDTKGMHASIQFRVQHLGYSWLYGRFNKFAGKFSYDGAAPEKSTVDITIKTGSVDTNHALRDKHLRSKDFLNVDKFPEARFVSTAFVSIGKGKGVLKGKFTLNGVTKPIEIAVSHIGGGKDPWGGFRRGFEGTAHFAMADYGILKNLGPKSKNVELILAIEGVKAK